MKEDTIKMTSLIREIRKQMNGAVSSSMRGKGINYGINYGVSLPTIRDLCKKYRYDSKFASFLIQQDIRELKLAAVYIHDPAEYRIENLALWQNNLTTTELMDNASLFLFALSPCWKEIFDKWVSGDNVLLVPAALNIAGKKLRSAIPDDEICKELLLKSVDAIQKTPYIPERYIIYFFTGFAGISCQNNIYVRKVLEKWKSDTSLVRIYEEIISFID